MELRELRRHWDLFGRTDPMWAVLSAPDKKFGRWRPEDFFGAGVNEIGLMLAEVDRAIAATGRTLRRGRALDFGCGIGRLTQALCGHFARCDGVDIAPSMIAGARRWNSHPDRCFYHLNERPDLSLFPDATFDFLYSAHVLQHMEPRFARGYVAEFLRVLAPGGVAAFETVTEPVVGASSALPPQALRAQIRLQDVPHEMPAGQRGLVTARVRNMSSCTWPAAGTNGWYQVTVGNHWLDTRGHVVVNDDARALLPADVEPGQSISVELEVTAPMDPGEYVLSIDLVQEGVGWFHTHLPRRGRRARVLVTASPPASTSLDIETPRAQMEMYGVPEAEIVSWVEAAGGRMLDVIDWTRISRARSYDWERRVFIAMA